MCACLQATAISAATKAAVTDSDGGTGIYDGMVEAGAQFATAANLLRSSNASVSAGAGVGFGLSVQCNNTVLFSYGLAFGGGMSASGCVCDVM